MIIIDKELERLEAAETPIRVGLVGMGFMGRGIARKIERATPGIRLVGVASRHLGGSARELCENPDIEVIVEATGTVEHAARVAHAAIVNRKHFVAMNAELDGTVGPILKIMADKMGVVYTNAGGDEPGVLMDLYRFVKGIGLRPVLCGNIKTFLDTHKTPDDILEFARRWRQRPHMIAAFTDGTKLSFEQAIVANATCMKVWRRGMIGPVVKPGIPIEEAAIDCFRGLLPEVASLGIVDYVMGAHPPAGVFVLGICRDHNLRHYLEYYKMGPGPLYCFYTPHHLCHFEISNTIARAALFHDATIAPVAPYVDVIAVAKRDLKAGETLDRMGGYLTYGLCENSSMVYADSLLPMGLAEGCVLLRDVLMDQALTYNDVALPEGRLCDRLRAAQNDFFMEGEHAN